MKERKEDIEMVVAGLVLDPGTNAPIVILKDKNSDICLPIWIGMAEATAIASALKKVEAQRPMTHDLLKDIIDQLGGRVVKIVVTSLKENTFLANVEIVCGDSLHVIDSRPSDAIALAVRTSCPIRVSAQVLEQAQVTLVAINSSDSDEMEFRPVNDEHGLSANFSNIEKDKWAEILAEMDPEDFKYKM